MTETIIIFICAILAPIAEFLLTALFDKIESRKKWHPFRKRYSQSLKNANSDCFSMIMEPHIKSSVLTGIIGFGFLFFTGIISLFLFCLFGKIRVLDFALASLAFCVICLPYISVFLHFYTKQVYITNDTVFIKTLFIKKPIPVSNIIQVTEDKFNRKNFFRISTADILIIKTPKNKFKITKNYSNYELAKAKFAELKLLSN